MREISQPSDFEEMLAAEWAVTFLHVDWSIYSLQAIPIFEELEAAECDSACSWWLINLTEKHDLWHLTYDWVKRQRKDTSYLLDTGYGAMIWSKRGEIKESIPRKKAFHVK